MSLINISYASNILNSNNNITLIYPDNIKRESVNILYLLHGYSGSNYDWTRYTNIIKLVSDKNLVVVMPDFKNSFYTNMKYGFNYFDYLTEELPSFIEQTFNLKHKKENTYIFGLSMGGYGALKAALTYPNKYNGAASFSGVVNIKNVYDRLINRDKVLNGIFGSKEELLNNLNKHDLFKLTKNINNNLKLYLSCGKDDFLYDDNKTFKKHLKENNINHQYVFKDGDHNWDFWNEEINYAINLFFK